MRFRSPASVSSKRVAARWEDPLPSVLSLEAPVLFEKGRRPARGRKYSRETLNGTGSFRQATTHNIDWSETLGLKNPQLPPAIFADDLPPLGETNPLRTSFSTVAMRRKTDRFQKSLPIYRRRSPPPHPSRGSKRNLPHSVAQHSPAGGQTECGLKLKKMKGEQPMRHDKI
jgi:hypothetical protein